MFNLFSKNFLGIDIGTGQIKVVELAKNKNRFVLKNYAIWTLGVDSDKVIQASSLNILESDVANHLKDLFKKSNIHAKEGVISVPSFSAFSMVVDMPKIPAKELAKAIEFEARHYVPVPLKDVHLDWTLIRDKKIEKTDSVIQTENHNGSVQKQEVLIAAVPNNLLHKYEEIARKVGIRLKALELETFAIARILSLDLTDPILIIDLGKRSTSLSIVEQGVVFLSRNLDTASNEVSRAIANSLGVSFGRAEEIKKIIGMAGDVNIKNVISFTLDIIINEAIRTVGTYFQKYQKKPSKAVLVGGLANLKGLLGYFAEKLDMKTEIGDPWKNIDYPKILEPTLRELSAMLTIAIGLAMRESY